jgi:hypothetical protein
MARVLGQNLLPRPATLGNGTMGGKAVRVGDYDTGGIMIPLKRPPLKEETMSRFMKHIFKDSNNCWLWTGCSFKNGYGRMRFGKFTRVPHRVSYELMIGSIPDGLLVCHSCDVRLCCNPDHLFLGTDADNIRDCQTKGRRAVFKGELHPMSKLKESDILTIRERRIKGEFLSKIADDFFVTASLVSMISKHKIWRHI